MSSLTRSVFIAATFILGFSISASAQQVVVSTPFQSINDSFYENIGMTWGWNRMRPDGSGFFFNGPGAALPPFGNHDPNSDGRFGFARTGRNGSGFFNFTFGQGNSRSITSTTPSVVVPNGYGGSISDTTQRPFVTGIIPVLGFRPPVPMVPTYTSPLGATREQIYQNVQRIRSEQLNERAADHREQEKEDAEALAEEQARLRNLVKNGKSSGDDPPLRLIGQ